MWVKKGSKMAGMERIAVESGVIEALAYDENSSVLKVWYKSGEVHEHYDVPRDIFETLLTAKSKGYYLNWIIKPAFRSKRIK
jgi:hypothetical protein